MYKKRNAGVKIWTVPGDGKISYEYMSKRLQLDSSCVRFFLLFVCFNLLSDTLNFYVSFTRVVKNKIVIKRNTAVLSS